MYNEVFMVLDIKNDKRIPTKVDNKNTNCAK
jgi:hypothetical protein